MPPQLLPAQALDGKPWLGSAHTTAVGAKPAAYAQYAAADTLPFCKIPTLAAESYRLRPATQQLSIIRPSTRLHSDG